MSRRKQAVSAVLPHSPLPSGEATGGAPTKSTPRIATIILAGALSRRLGRAKALLRWGEKTLLDHVVSQASGLRSSPLFVVLGPDSEEILETCDLETARIVVNPRWREGTSSSLRAAFQAMEEDPPFYDAALVVRGDHPAIPREFLHTLLDRYGRNGCDYVASCYSGRIGVPAVLDRSRFSGLTRLKGDLGAESLLLEGCGRCCIVPFPGEVVEVDFPQECELVARP